jgi:hypothetical protein
MTGWYALSIACHKAALMTEISFMIVKGRLPSKVEVGDELRK